MTTERSGDDSELVGTTLHGGFKVLRFVAEGGMGDVFEGRGPNGDRVAIKVLHAALTSKPEVSFRFRREGEIVASIKSRYVPKLLGRGRDPRGRPFMVFEFAEGRPLSEWISELGRLPLNLALEITIQMSRALIAAHAAGVVHRDLKPDNVIVGGEPEEPAVMVLDFSVSKSEDLQFTQTGTVIGTPCYMPPEQARGDAANNLVDIYAIGAILYDMVCARPPYEWDEPGRVLAKLLTEPPPRPRTLAPLLPESLEAIILRATARDPKDRYPIVEALLEALEREQRELTARGSSPTLSPDPPMLPQLEVEPIEQDSPARVAARARAKALTLGVVGVSVLVALLLVLGLALGR